MGARFPTAVTNAFIGPLPATAAETIVFTTPPMVLPVDSCFVFLYFSCDITAGTGVTRHVFLIRRGTALGGATVFAVNEVKNQVAGVRDSTFGNYFDNPGFQSPIQYTLTIQQTAATGAGVFNDGCLLAMVL